MQKRFVAKIYKALRRQISSFITVYRYGNREMALRLVTESGIGTTIQRMYILAGRYAARRARGMMRKGLGFNDRLTDDIREYFRLYLLEKVVLPITETTKARIETVLNEAIEKGWSIDETIRHLESDVFREMTRVRAKMIVRTESIRASNYGQLFAANESEFQMLKEWIAVNDNRTRRTHRHGSGVDGEKRDLYTAFSNGLQYPGDPAGPPGETINCRCVLGFEIKRDSRGRPIPRTEPLFSSIGLAQRLTAA